MEYMSCFNRECLLNFEDGHILSILSSKEICQNFLNTLSADLAQLLENRSLPNPYQFFISQVSSPIWLMIGGLY
mgnify:CR=1 FL=1